MKKLVMVKVRQQAPPLKRILAGAIDFLVIDFIIIRPFGKVLARIIPSFATYAEAVDFAARNQGTANTLLGVMCAIAALVFLYFTILEWKTGQSIGKMILNITLVSEGKVLSFWQVALRNLVFAPIFPVILLWIIDPGYMAFGRDKRRLMDILCRTNVVEEKILVK